MSNGLPDYQFLPAPLWLITVLHVLTLTLHFVAMNFVVGGVIIVLWGRFTDRWQHSTVRRFVKAFPVAMAATVTLGVAPLLFVQLVYYGPIYSASIVSGWFWLGIVAAVIFAYYFLYGAAFTEKTDNRRKWYLSLTLIGLLYVSFVYSSVFSLAEHPQQYAQLYAANQSGFVINPNVGDYIYRWLHMLLGAITVGGFFIGLLGRDHEDAFKVGKTFFLWGMVAAGLIGFVYLFNLMEIIKPLMRSPAIYILTGSIALSALSLHFFFQRNFWVSGGMLFVSLLGMVITRHYVRLFRLADSFDPATIPVQPQWGVFGIFLVCFLIALGVIYWLVKTYRSGRLPAAG